MSRQILWLFIVLVWACFVLGFLVGRAHACDSYDDCIGMAKRTSWVPFMAKCYSDQAMAYKLSDLNDTLGRLELGRDIDEHKEKT